MTEAVANEAIPRTDTRYRPCIVCGDEASREPWVRIQNLQYVHCLHCGLIYVDRFAVDADMYQAYTGGRLKSLRRRLLAPFRKMRSLGGYEHFRQRGQQIFEFAHARAPQVEGQPRYLDIGCNKGFLLAEGIARGYDVHGVELVWEVIQPFLNTWPAYRQQVYSEKFSLVAARFDDDWFDIITGIDVVEHFEDPVADLQHIYRILKPGGVLVLQTPDVDGAMAQTEKTAWGALKPLEHLHLFGHKHFPAFAETMGFSGIEIHGPFDGVSSDFVAVLRK